MSANRVCASFFPATVQLYVEQMLWFSFFVSPQLYPFTAEFYVILYSLRLEASQLSLWRGVGISYSIHWCIAADGRSGSVLAVSLVFFLFIFIFYFIFIFILCYFFF